MNIDVFYVMGDSGQGQWSTVPLEINDADYGKEYVRALNGYKIKKVGSLYRVHCEEGDYILMMDKTRVSFYNNGYRCRIEDLPWSNEAKLMAKLRHGDCDGYLGYSL